jgi:hypothetical protein
MRRITPTLVVLVTACSLLLISPLFFHKNDMARLIPLQEKELQSALDENERTDGPERLMYQEFLMARDPALNLVPTERIIEAKRKMNEMELAASRGSGLSGTQSLTWQERGPNNIGGRTRALLIDRSDASGNTVFAAGVGGGLWKTTNFKTTATWTAINDFFSNMAITCIKQSPTDPLIMYFGTGEGFANIDAIQGLGIWKSINGGTSWVQLSSTTNIAFVNDLEFDNNGYIYAATRSTVAGLRGIIRSTDGGANWTQVVTDPIPTAISRGSDLEKAANGDMYATLGILSTGHIFRSAANGTNTGISGSWTNITPSSVITNKDQRIELAVCPNNSSRIYAITQDSVTAGVDSIFRSDNSGSSWIHLTDAHWCDQGSGTSSIDFSRVQAWYDLILAVDPNDDATVFAGGVVVEKTTNAGGSWTQATRWTSTATCNTSPVIHADIHEIQFLNSSELIICNDGGIYYSTDGGASFVNKNGGYNITQYYGIAVSPASGSNTMIAGSQDNGSHLFSSSGINSVSSVTGGDGGFCFIDKTNSSVWITSNPAGIFNTYRNNGGTFVSSEGTGNFLKERFIDPADYADTLNVLYCGDLDGLYGRVANVESGITNYTTVSVSAEMGTNRQVSCVKVDPNDETTIWLGCSVAEDASSNVAPNLLKVIRANNSTGGAPANRPSATAFTGPSLPAGAYISSIDIEPGNSNHMILSVSNYGVASVWESTDGGTNWNSLDNNGVNLPDMPIRWAIFTPSGYLAGRTSSIERISSIGGVMLATELGVWTATSLNGTSTVWTAQNSGLANVRTDQLILRNSDKLVAAATHGRGVFTTTLLTTPLALTLVDFTASLQNKNVLLEWSTSSEYNSKDFELEKSFDGVNYHKIATVPAAGTSNSLLHYSWLDMERLSEYNYYRLKSVDIDGNGKLSKAVLIKLPDVRQEMYILGNPFHDNITVRFVRVPQGKIVFRLTDISGKLIRQTVFNDLSQGQIQFILPAVNLSKGVYLLNAMVDGEIFTERILKQ